MDFKPPSLNSPVEFVLIGPLQGRDKILLRSKGAAIDLPGLIVDKGFDGVDEPHFSLIHQMLFGRGRQMNMVATSKTSDVEPDSDSRKSSYRFAWVGHCSEHDRQKIEQLLNQSIFDIKNSLREDNISDIELSIAQVIYICAKANERRRRTLRLFWFTLAVYAFIGLAYAIVLILRKI